MTRSALILLGALLVASGSASAGVNEIEDLQLSDLLSMNTSISSLSPTTIRESPGIVTVLTRDDLLASGARNLVDVLRQVPGFDIELDAHGVTSLGFRGIWGQEGKILLLVDGQEMNDLLYGTVQLGSQYPLDNVESIEISRGPGSVLYGGHAELAVIKITTRSGGYARVTGVYSQLDPLDQGPDFLDAYARRTVTASVGHVFAPDVEASASVYAGQAQGAYGPYVDAYGGQVDLSGQNVARPLFANVAVAFHGLSIRVIEDDYRTTDRDGFNQVLPETEHKDFVTTAAEVRYQWSLSKAWTLTPWLSYRRSTPWHDALPASPTFYDVTGTEYAVGALATVEVDEHLHVSTGADFRDDDAFPNQPAADVFERSGLVARQAASSFLEVGLEHRLANLDAGVRFQVHTLYGPVIVPRLAVTRIIGPFHFKLLGSYAFRDPDLEASAYNPQLDLERTRIIEGEAGAKLSENLFVRMNVFDLTIDDPVVYVVDAFHPAGAYFNSTHTGSWGLESELRGEVHGASFSVNYSLYRSTNDVPSYRVAGHDELALAFPAHKLAATGDVSMGGGFHFNPSLVWTSTRYAYDERSPTGKGQVEAFAPVALLDAFLGWNVPRHPEVQLGVGAYDLLDTHDPFLQAYDSLHAPLPGMGREYLLRITLQQPSPRSR